MLTQLLSPAVCASCRLCCNFLPESAWETPALEEECAHRLRSMGIALLHRPEGGETIALEWPAGCSAANCPLLDPAQGCRLPRENRPLECRLWPFRLMRDDEERCVVAYYSSCPGLAAVPREMLVRTAEGLRGILEQRAVEFPGSVRRLCEGYEVLFVLAAES